MTKYFTETCLHIHLQHQINSTSNLSIFPQSESMEKVIREQRHCCFTSYLTAYNFIPHLQIPIEFLKNQAKNMCKTVHLITEDGESRVVKIEKIGKEYFFTTGWKKVAEELDLRNGELLLFKLVKKSKFDFSVYGNNGCYKKLCSTDDEQDGETENEDDEKDGSENIVNWTLKLTKDHESELELSKDLAKDAKITAREKLDVVNGRKLGRVYISKRHDKFYMTVGWNEFLVRNKIVVGSTVSLDFVRGSSNVIKFKLVKSRDGGGFFELAKKTKGRPPSMV